MKIILILIFMASIEGGLKDKTKRLYIGTAIGPFEDPVYEKFVIDQFNCVTPGNQLKWDAVEWTRGQHKYEEGTKLVEWGHQNNMTVRGHTLVWHSQLPPWVQKLEHNTTELKAAMEQHIKDEVSHLKGQIYSWDVVNEPFEEDGQLRYSLWSKNFNDSYISDALKAANSADPKAKLYINDFNVEGINAKSDALYNLVKKFKAEGVPIHGVGFQAHFIVGQIPSNLQANIQRFADLGLEVAITEMDVRIKLPATPALLEQQAKDYAQVFKACQAVNKCVGITLWGFMDSNSWIPVFFPGYGAANLWDSHYKAKPAVAAIEKVLTETLFQ